QMIFVVQIVVLGLIAMGLILMVRHWPHPSPLIRGLLPPVRRWPEAQIREWLKDQRFHPVFLTFFNRDPERTPPPGNDWLAPADGLITSTDILGDIRYIVIALSFWDMHVQRSPAHGRVQSVEPLGADYMDG